MPDILLVLTDRHNIDSVVAALPHGSVYVGITLRTAEWANVGSDQISREVLAPMYAEARRRWPESRTAPKVS